MKSHAAYFEMLILYEYHYKRNILSALWYFAPLIYCNDKCILNIQFHKSYFPLHVDTHMINRN